MLKGTPKKMSALRTLGVPYTDEEIGTAWLQRPGPPGPLDELLLDRLAIARVGQQVADRVGRLPAGLLQPQHLRAGADVGAMIGGVAGIEDDQPGVIDPAVRIDIGGAKPRPQRRAGDMLAQVDRLRRRQRAAATDMIVEEEAEAQQPARAQPLDPGQDELHHA